MKVNIYVNPKSYYNPVYEMYFYHGHHFTRKELDDNFSISDKSYKTKNPALLYYHDNEGVISNYIWYDTEQQLKHVDLTIIRNLYEFMLFAKRVWISDKSFLDYSGETACIMLKYQLRNLKGMREFTNIIFMIQGINDFGYVYSKSDDSFIKFYFNINPVLFWEKDLRNHGSIDNQLRFVLGEKEYQKRRNDFSTFTPDYQIKIKKDSKNKEYISPAQNQNDKESELQENQNIGFVIEPPEKHKFNIKHFMYGYLIGLLFSGIIYIIIKIFLF